MSRRLRRTEWLGLARVSTHQHTYRGVRARGGASATGRYQDCRLRPQRDKSCTDADAETRVRWHASNSTIDRVFRFPHHIAVVHVRPRLELGWVFGQQLDFVALMNVYTLSGELVKSDVPLPDLAVGQDDEGVFVVDYGKQGRRGDKTSVTLVRIAEP